MKSFIHERHPHVKSKKESKVYTDIAVRSLTGHTATGTRIACRITQCYLPPDRGDISACTPAEAGSTTGIYRYADRVRS